MSLWTNWKMTTVDDRDGQIRPIRVHVFVVCVFLVVDQLLSVGNLCFDTRNVAPQFLRCIITR